MDYAFLIPKALPLTPAIKCRGRHVTFILLRKRILSVGIANSWKTNPLAEKYGYRFAGTHAELDAILRFPLPPAELRHCSIVNIRFLSDGTPAIAKPCPKCMELIKDFHLKELYYTNRFGKMIKGVIEDKNVN